MSHSCPMTLVINFTYTYIMHFYTVPFIVIRPRTGARECWRNTKRNLIICPFNWTVSISWESCDIDDVDFDDTTTAADATKKMRTRKNGRTHTRPTHFQRAVSGVCLSVRSFVRPFVRRCAAWNIHKKRTLRAALLLAVVLPPRGSFDVALFTVLCFALCCALRCVRAYE